MSTFIIAFIIFALTGLSIRYYIKGKGSCGDCECSCPVKEEMHKAHAFQTKLITEEASGNSVEVNVLLIHAQDHLMNAMNF